MSKQSLADNVDHCLRTWAWGQRGFAGWTVQAELSDSEPVIWIRAHFGIGPGIKYAAESLSVETVEPTFFQRCVETLIRVRRAADPTTMPREYDPPPPWAAVGKWQKFGPRKPRPLNRSFA